MAELATIARPYAEAAFKAVSAQGAQAQRSLADLLDELAAVAAHPQVRSVADNPKVSAQQVAELFASACKTALPAEGKSLLNLLIENGRLPALPEIAAQFRALKNRADGVSDATIYSAFPLEGAALADLQALLEKKFGRKLTTQVKTDASLIGGVRVVVGDEVLDTSVKARLEKMKVTLMA
jgi:F-type H+-transporting ATPase subunit delta